MKMPSLKRNLLTSCVALGLITGCSSKPMNASDEERYAALTSVPETTSQRNSETFRRRVDHKERYFDKTITVQGIDLPMVEILNDVFPEVNVVPADSSVDVTRPVNISAAGMTVNDFLRYMESASGYELTLRKNDTLLVEGFVSRQFNLAAFTSSRYSRSDVSTRSSSAAELSSTDGGDGGDQSTGAIAGTQSYVESVDDHWEDLIEGARDILGVKDEDDDDEDLGPNQVDLGVSQSRLLANAGSVPSLTQEPFLTASRATGLVVAAGLPERMRLLSSYFDNSNDLATKQVHVDFKMYDVTLRDSAATGIDWNALAELDLNGNPLNLGLTGSADFINGQNVWGLAGQFQSDRVSVDLLLNFLKQYGKTELINQPSLTLRNGATSVINAGEQFSLIGGFEQAQDVNGNVTQTPIFDRIQVGVTLQVSARVLDDERLMLDIVPVVSSISGEDAFTIDGNDFSIPRTALQQLTTQVIARSGRPIKLGGLITRKIASELSGLPFRDSLGNAFNFLFDSEQNELEKRELVLVVTPQIIEEV